MKRIRRLLYPIPAGPSAPFLAALILIAVTTITMAAWRVKIPSSGPSAVNSAAQKESHSRYTGFINGPTQYLITPQERIAFLQLTTQQERERFIQQFWNRRNPYPGAPENQYKEEFYRRVSYTDEHFEYSAVPGWKADRGHCYIAYGPPDELKHYSKGSHGPYAVEMWHYHHIPGIGRNVQFVFVDRAGNGDFRLTLKPSGVQGTVIWPMASKQRAAEGSSKKVVITIDKTQGLYVGNQAVNIHNLGSIVSEKLDGNPRVAHTSYLVAMCAK